MCKCHSFYKWNNGHFCILMLYCVYCLLLTFSSWPALELIRILTNHFLEKNMYSSEPKCINSQNNHVLVCKIAQKICFKNYYLQVAEKVKEFFHNEGIHSTTIQPEFVETAEHLANGSITSTDDCMLACPKGALPDPACDASKCCPPTTGSRVPSTGQFPNQSSPPIVRPRRPSSVSISDGLICGVNMATASRRSAPNLAATLDEHVTQVSTVYKTD